MAMKDLQRLSKEYTVEIILKKSVSRFSTFLYILS